MRIIAIDPGNERSAMMLYGSNDKAITLAGIYENEDVRRRLRDDRDREYGTHAQVLVVEMIASYGMPVGKEVFDTCLWIGRFCEAWEDATHRVELIYRKDVKMHLCVSMQAKDSNIRQALIDKFPATGGGKCPQIGTKKEPGPLYGISGDEWSALAVAITWADKNA